MIFPTSNKKAVHSMPILALLSADTGQSSLPPRWPRAEHCCKAARCHRTTSNHGHHKTDGRFPTVALSHQRCRPLWLMSDSEAELKNEEKCHLQILNLKSANFVQEVSPVNKFKNICFGWFNYNSFVIRMHLWWSLCTCRRLGSLLLCLCDIFNVLIHSLVCWFCKN